jgi:hemerythrin-like domain-containing protein
MPVDVIKKMQIEHANMAKVLRLLEIQLQLLHEGDTQDFDLMQDIMDYMMNFEDLIHHPKENIIYEKLKQRNPNITAIVDELLQEHEDLSYKTKAFANTINEIVLDAMIPREEIVDQGKAFIARNLEHIKKEDTIVFPAILKSLQDEDWKEIVEYLPKQDDPLTGKDVEEQYQKLYESIMAIS